MVRRKDTFIPFKSWRVKRNLTIFQLTFAPSPYKAFADNFANKSTFPYVKGKILILHILYFSPPFPALEKLLDGLSNL